MKDESYRNYNQGDRNIDDKESLCEKNRRADERKEYNNKFIGKESRSAPVNYL